MTERLYYSDSYTNEFEATVVATGDQGRRLYLDRSAFYPTSGGQPFDRGLLTVPGATSEVALSVIDVIDEGERVAHVLEGEPPPGVADGARVIGRIDWARRFDHMQQHTGQHLLSALFQEMLGLTTLSVHFGAESSTLDLDTGALTLTQLQRVEARANATVFENRVVAAEVQEAGAAEGLRKASARVGPLRVVSIAGLDRSACGGTHVRQTGEIGAILLRKQERVRKAARIEFLCGGRATTRARADYEALAGLAASLSTSVDGVASLLTARLAELEMRGAALRESRAALDVYRARELYAKAAPGADGLVVSVERRPSGSLEELRGLAQAYSSLPKAVFVAATEAPPAVLLATSEDSGVNAGALLKTALTRAGGRGGGSARMAQGTVEGTEALASVLESLRPSAGDSGSHAGPKALG
jgi:alanyl-tRNA synthetase